MSPPLFALIIISFTTLGILLICFAVFDFDEDESIFDPLGRVIKFMKKKVSNLFKVIIKNFEF